MAPHQGIKCPQIASEPAGGSRCRVVRPRQWKHDIVKVVTFADKIKKSAFICVHLRPKEYVSTLCLGMAEMLPYILHCRLPMGNRNLELFIGSQGYDFVMAL